MRNPNRASCRVAASLVAATMAAAVQTPHVGADGIGVAIENGRVTLSANEASLSDVLAEWSRVGGTRFVGGDRLGGNTVTLHLVDADEAEALRLLLRSAAGYVAAPRRRGTAGAARYDRVTILAARTTSARPPAVDVAATPPHEAVAGNPPPGATGAPAGLVPMDELQRLLDAAAEANAASMPAATPAAAGIPIQVTPFPGVATTAGFADPPGR